MLRRLRESGRAPSNFVVFPWGEFCLFGGWIGKRLGRWRGGLLPARRLWGVAGDGRQRGHPILIFGTRAAVGRAHTYVGVSEKAVCTEVGPGSIRGQQGLGALLLLGRCVGYRFVRRLRTPATTSQPWVSLLRFRPKQANERKEGSEQQKDIFCIFRLWWSTAAPKVDRSDAHEGHIKERVVRGLRRRAVAFPFFLCAKTKRPVIHRARLNDGSSSSSGPSISSASWWRCWWRLAVICAGVFSVLWPTGFAAAFRYE